MNSCVIVLPIGNVQVSTYESDRLVTTDQSGARELSTWAQLAKFHELFRCREPWPHHRNNFVGYEPGITSATPLTPRLAPNCTPPAALTRSWKFLWLTLILSTPCESEQKPTRKHRHDGNEIVGNGKGNWVPITNHRAVLTFISSTKTGLPLGTKPL